MTQIQPFLSGQGVLSYCIHSKTSAILIDPSYDEAQNIIRYLIQNSLTITDIFETHTHADFFSSKELFLKLFPDIRIHLHKNSPTRYTTDPVGDNQVFQFDDYTLTALFTPGHTSDSVTYLLETSEFKALFTGDTLLIGGTGRTDFQAGSSEDLYNSLERLLEYPDQTIIYPNHNYSRQVKTTLGVEKVTNKRLRLVTQGKKADFIKLMNNHTPPTPDFMSFAVPYNSL